MSYGKLISQLRYDKNLSIKDLCANQLSRSAYFRFTKGETQTSVETFFSMIKTLHISPAEFDYIYNGYAPPLYEKLHTCIMQCYKSKDTTGINLIIGKCDCLSQQANDCYHHAGLLARFFLSKLNNMPVDINISKEFQSYLTHVNTWHLYELQLFNYTIPLYSYDFIKSSLSRVIKNSKKYDSFPQTRRISFLILTNIFKLHLEHFDLKQASLVIDSQAGLPRQAHDLFEQLHIKLNHGLLLLAKKKVSEANSLIMQVLSVSRLLNQSSLLELAINGYRDICRLYDIEPQISLQQLIKSSMRFDNHV